MPPPKRPGPKQNLVAKITLFCQTAKKKEKKVTKCSIFLLAGSWIDYLMPPYTLLYIVDISMYLV